MRGKAFSVSQAHNDGGITPAYAGKRDKSRSNCMMGRDHPRVCGEKCIVFTLNIPGAGSPPRMRGKDGAESVTVASSRITPAYAGKSFSTLCQSVEPQDHPRVCGEKS